MERKPNRRTPAKGVHTSFAGPNWVFLTVCTKDREPWLANVKIQKVLHDIWHDKATAWLVSDYLLMPDHLHLFCALHDDCFSIERWVAYWKDQLSKTCPEAGSFQRGCFHHRLRNDENYSEKWIYVRENPVRAGLVEEPDDWPFQGRVHEIRWSD